MSSLNRSVNLHHGGLFLLESGGLSTETSKPNERIEDACAGVALSVSQLLVWKELLVSVVTAAAAALFPVFILRTFLLIGQLLRFQTPCRPSSSTALVVLWCLLAADNRRRNIMSIHVKQLNTPTSIAAWMERIRPNENFLESS